MHFLRTLIVLIVSQTLIFAPVLHAQEDLTLSSGDIIAPKIQHNPINTEAQIGEPIIISAEITDDSGVKEVILHYREIGSSQFIRIGMPNEMGTDNYSASLPGIQPPGIEYYIQATDMAGNSLLRGHSFDPLTVTIAPTPTPQAVEDDASPTSTSSGKKVNWLWVGLGVLVVGALAAAAGGGGDDGPDPVDEPISVDVSASIPE